MYCMGQPPADDFVLPTLQTAIPQRNDYLVDLVKQLIVYEMLARKDLKRILNDLNNLFSLQIEI